MVILAILLVAVVVLFGVFACLEGKFRESSNTLVELRDSDPILTGFRFELDGIPIDLDGIPIRS